MMLCALPRHPIEIVYGKRFPLEMRALDDDGEKQNNLTDVEL